MTLAFLVASMLAQSAQAQCRSDLPAVKAVREIADRIVAADNARDVAKVVDSYAADAWLLPPNAEPVQGRAAIRPRYDALFAGFNPAIEGRIDEVCVSGGTAFVRGHNGGMMHSRSGAASRVLNDAYLMLLKVDADGRWRISHLMWHPEK